MNSIAYAAQTAGAPFMREGGQERRVAEAAGHRFNV
ncbi:hypothetical protein LA6_000719 [Marinibacterium anthonyi]|nr:hypothetical protein LA6_000719 [Marinibacterium anthonyi]